MKDRAQRVSRTPVNGTRNVLTVTNKDPDFVYRIVNDSGDRVSTMQERGYEIVTDKTVKIGDKRVATATAEGSPVTASVGGGMKGILMKIRKEWYEEDQAAKQAEVDETEQSIKQTVNEGSYGKIDLGRQRG